MDSGIFPAVSCHSERSACLSAAEGQNPNGIFLPTSRLENHALFYCHSEQSEESSMPMI
jgi:hypothetical protein